MATTSFSDYHRRNAHQMLALPFHSPSSTRPEPPPKRSTPSDSDTPRTIRDDWMTRDYRKTSVLAPSGGGRERSVAVTGDGISSVEISLSPRDEGKARPRSFYAVSPAPLFRPQYRGFPLIKGRCWWLGGTSVWLCRDHPVLGEFPPGTAWHPFRRRGQLPPTMTVLRLSVPVLSALGP